jgi:hypothetical protein
MRTLAVCAVFAALPIAAPAHQEKASRPPHASKKGDAIVARGCLNGSVLEALEVGAKADAVSLPAAVTFRLTGDKALLKQMREEADGTEVEVQGKLKSDLPQENGQGRKVGKVRITIGTPAVMPGSVDAERKRSLPALEVTSFEGSTVRCGR